MSPEVSADERLIEIITRTMRRSLDGGFLDDALRIAAEIYALKLHKPEYVIVEYCRRTREKSDARRWLLAVLYFLGEMSDGLELPTLNALMQVAQNANEAVDIRELALSGSVAVECFHRPDAYFAQIADALKFARNCGAAWSTWFFEQMSRQQQYLGCRFLAQRSLQVGMIVVPDTLLEACLTAEMPGKREFQTIGYSSANCEALRIVFAYCLVRRMMVTGDKFYATGTPLVFTSHLRGPHDPCPNSGPHIEMTWEQSADGRLVLQDVNVVCYVGRYGGAVSDSLEDR